jgi:beta-1,4-N-acetylglucosaminyltransferase
MGETTLADDQSDPGPGTRAAGSIGGIAPLVTVTDPNRVPLDTVQRHQTVLDEPAADAPVASENESPAGAELVSLLVCSSGGHLDQLMRLRSWWGQGERHWVTFALPDAESRLGGETTTWAYFPTTRNLKNFVRNLFLARRVLRQVRPDVIISTGAGLAVPFFLLARFYGARTVFLEVFDRVDSTTLTGRLCRPLADLFLVQWPEQQALYRGSVLIGSVYP